MGKVTRFEKQEDGSFKCFNCLDVFFGSTIEHTCKEFFVTHGNVTHKRSECENCEDCIEVMNNYKDAVRTGDMSRLLHDENGENSPYCPHCGTCGYIGCCGVVRFLNTHVRGKTNCLNEESMIEEIISLWDNRDEV